MKLSDLKIDKKDPKFIVMLVMLVILIVILYRHYSGQEVGRSGLAQSSSQKGAAVMDPYFNVDVLTPNNDTSGSKGRDPFSFSTCLPKPGEAPPPPPPPPPPKIVDTVIDAPPPPPVIQEPPEMANIKIFGVLNLEGKDLYAFLSDGKDVYVVHQNDVFANQFKITHLDEEKIEISTVKGNFKKTLIITGG